MPTEIAKILRGETAQQFEVNDDARLFGSQVVGILVAYQKIEPRASKRKFNRARRVDRSRTFVPKD